MNPTTSKTKLPLSTSHSNLLSDFEEETRSSYSEALKKKEKAESQQTKKLKLKHNVRNTRIIGNKEGGHGEGLGVVQGKGGDGRLGIVEGNGRGYLEEGEGGGEEAGGEDVGGFVVGEGGAEHVEGGHGVLEVVVVQGDGVVNFRENELGVVQADVDEEDAGVQIGAFGGVYGVLPVLGNQVLAEGLEGDGHPGRGGEEGILVRNDEGLHRFQYLPVRFGGAKDKEVSGGEHTALQPRIGPVKLGVVLPGNGNQLGQLLLEDDVVAARLGRGLAGLSKGGIRKVLDEGGDKVQEPGLEGLKIRGTRDERGVLPDSGLGHVLLGVIEVSGDPAEVKGPGIQPERDIRLDLGGDVGGGKAGVGGDLRAQPGEHGPGLVGVHRQRRPVGVRGAVQVQGGRDIDEEQGGNGESGQEHLMNLKKKNMEAYLEYMKWKKKYSVGKKKRWGVSVDKYKGIIMKLFLAYVMYFINNIPRLGSYNQSDIEKRMDEMVTTFYNIFILHFLMICTLIPIEVCFLITSIFLYLTQITKVLNIYLVTDFVHKNSVEVMEFLRSDKVRDKIICHGLDIDV